MNPAPRLTLDVVALEKLTASAEPAATKCRVGTAMSALYLMGDASGQGFGSGLWDGEGLWYEAGNWADHHRDETSNWKEANNLTLKVEELGKAGKLNDAELFIFTDNSVFEGTFFRGHSKSKKLNDIIFRLRMLEKETCCILHVIHIAGTRMKRAGIDGLSRGDFLEGMVAGKNPLDYIPLNEGAGARSNGKIEAWVKTWWNDASGQPWCGQKLKVLQPNDWFDLPNNQAPRLWLPPPAAMETVVELFNEDHLAHPHIPHVFVVPRLMTHLWRKQLSKDADVLFTVKSGSSFWPCSMHEPLIVLIVLPLVHVQHYSGPWKQRGGQRAHELEDLLEAGFKHPVEHGCEKNS